LQEAVHGIHHPLSRFGFLLAGFLPFSADALHVVRNPAFQSKLLLIAAALVSVVTAHLEPWRRMMRTRFAILVASLAILLGCGTAANSARAGEAEAWSALRNGRHVALMRHADAPGGGGDPPGFKVEDCATQRNLSAKGGADALKIGARLKSEGIALEAILSSPWCRCIDTATLLQLGPVKTEATFGNVVVLREQREALTSGARAVIDQWTGSGILLVVTHGANIQALTGIQPASGEIVVVRGGSGGGREAVGRLVLD
jgi:phosphohistidine phosphatase SixA